MQYQQIQIQCPIMNMNMNITNTNTMSDHEYEPENDEKNICHLSCKFIQEDFNIDLFKNYFTKEGWETVNKLYSDKLNLVLVQNVQSFSFLVRKFLKFFSTSIA